MSGFRRSFGISVLLHVLAAVAVISVIVHQPRPLRISEPPSAFDRAIPISLAPQPRPQPKPTPPQPKVPPAIKPPPAAIETQASQVPATVPPPTEKPTPPQTTPERPEETRAPDYQEIVEGLLEQNKQYPKQAVLAGIEGEVEISFLVNAQGTVLGYTIVRSSHEQVLDDEVVRLIHRVRFPPVPGGDNRTRLPIDVTIEFSLH